MNLKKITSCFLKYFLCFCIALAGCTGQDKTEAQKLAEQDKTVTLISIEITPVEVSIGIAKTEQFTAIGTYSDESTRDITSSVIWFSSNPFIATIAPTTGLATGITLGSSQIVAFLGDIHSSVANLEVVILPPPPYTIIKIDISNTKSSILINENTQFTAIATHYDQSTEDVTEKVKWESSNTDITTINELGLAAGISIGISEISATLDGISSAKTPLFVNLKYFPINLAPLERINDVTMDKNGKSFWYSEIDYEKPDGTRSAIVQQTLDGKVIKFPVYGSDSRYAENAPYSLEFAFDNTIHFVKIDGKVYQMTLDGHETVFPIALCQSVCESYLPNLIISDLDGSMWFSAGPYQILHATPTGSVTRYYYNNYKNDYGTYSAHPIKPILLDGNVWSLISEPIPRTKEMQHFLNKMTVKGENIKYVLPDSAAGYSMFESSNSMAVTSNGEHFFSITFGNSIHKLSTQGVFTEYPIPQHFCSSAQRINVLNLMTINDNLWAFGACIQNDYVWENFIVKMDTNTGNFTKYDLPTNIFIDKILKTDNGSVWFWSRQRGIHAIK